MTDVAQEYKLYHLARFNSSVKKLEWNDNDLKWYTTVSRDGGKDSEYSSSYRVVSDFVVSSIGQLCKPKGFDIPGLSDFAGKVMHTARWDRGFDLTGKKVALVGTGKLDTSVLVFAADLARRNKCTGDSRGGSIGAASHSMSAYTRLRNSSTRPRIVSMAEVAESKCTFVAEAHPSRGNELSRTIPPGSDPS